VTRVEDLEVGKATKQSAQRRKREARSDTSGELLQTISSIGIPARIHVEQRFQQGLERLEAGTTG
jgi:hypothetical protein